MVLRIEYILIIVLSILILSIIGINPSSQSAIKSESDKEILFQNFSLLELKEKVLGKKILAKEAVKYNRHLDFKEMNLSNEFGDNILAGKVEYKDDAVYMEDNITLTSKEGLLFSSESIHYRLKDKVVKNSTFFTLDFNGSQIQGKNLEYSMKSRDISADKIHARILLTSTLE